MSPLTRATVSQECITAWNDLKLNKKLKYIIYKLSDDNKEIVVEEASADDDSDSFREKLINATSKNKMVCSDCFTADRSTTPRSANGLTGKSWQGASICRL